MFLSALCLVLVTAMLCCKSNAMCGKREYLTSSNICCRLCPKGWYIKVNCSYSDGGQAGTQCDRCSKCENRTLSPCTDFKNTVCEVVTPAPVPTENTFHGIRPPVLHLINYTALYITTCVLIVLVTVASVMKWKATHRKSDDPAKEPITMMV